MVVEGQVVKVDCLAMNMAVECHSCHDAMQTGLDEDYELSGR